jgi:hypothetical protein
MQSYTVTLKMSRNWKCIEILRIVRVYRAEDNYNQSFPSVLFLDLDFKITAVLESVLDFGVAS